MTEQVQQGRIFKYAEAYLNYVGLGKEQNYFRAVGILKEIRQIMKDNEWNEEWERKYDLFINQNRRKKY